MNELRFHCGDVDPLFSRRVYRRDGGLNQRRPTRTKFETSECFQTSSRSHLLYIYSEVFFIAIIGETKVRLKETQGGIIVSLSNAYMHTHVQIHACAHVCKGNKPYCINIHPSFSLSFDTIDYSPP